MIWSKLKAIQAQINVDEAKREILTEQIQENSLKINEIIIEAQNATNIIIDDILKNERAQMDQTFMRNSSQDALNSAETFRAENESFLQGLIYLLSGKLSPVILHPEALSEVFSKVQRAAAAQGLQTIGSDPSIIFESPATLILSPCPNVNQGCDPIEKIFIWIHLALAPADTFDLFEHLPIPKVADGLLVKFNTKPVRRYGTLYVTHVMLLAPYFKKHKVTKPPVH